MWRSTQEFRELRLKNTVAGQRGDATADQQHQGIAKIRGKLQQNNALSG